ncbi:hypothetical protein PUNSTDRAFT_117932 [Punctularia strigosozonata HHB-11173 SS5]|uniref:uncharacterized protein n=1 Tax=Punctularia strigosozonata (strain HHB-11173) TaxID=741275 RepID=UPI0004416BA8|nr:uncharacterized protein PUNSTDRAFT_117932 [Punctularia strigosozonata HHB-11173 SS5]EIN14438.1 hypothetical protein PUNSTDRAFT_117932 [Punctularia strigosozonata HHB-11173 SS5]
MTAGGFTALPSAEDGVHDGSKWRGVARILGPAWARLPALTVGLLGVQTAWSIEMAYASPYLLGLGLSKSYMAMVFLAGPISGLIVQPLIGVLADNSKSSMGRRRPYMLSAAAIVASGMLLLGFTREVSTLFTSSDLLTIWLAVLAIYIIDFSINAVQAVDRALIVDTLPTREQAAGNAWAARMLGIGSVAGFYIGNMDLPGWLPGLGKTELQVLVILGSVLLISTHLVTAFCVKERILVSSSRPTASFRKECRDIWDNMLSLPRVIRQICFIQFFAWIGWFPVLFYTTAYIGDLHVRASSLPANGDHSAVEAAGTRLGSRALFFHSVTALAANIVLPFFVVDNQDKGRSTALSLFESKTGKLFDKFKVHLATLWAASHLLFFLCMEGTWFTSSVAGNTTLFTILGFSWAITQWAPFVLLAEAILSESAAVDDASSISLGDQRTNHPRHLPDSVEETRPLFGAAEDVDAQIPSRGQSSESSARSSARSSLEGHRRASSALGIVPESDARLSRLDLHAHAMDAESEPRSMGASLAAKSGIILGIHNVFIVLPQLLSTGFSSLVFAMLDPDKSVLHGDHPGSIKPPFNGSSESLPLTTPLVPRQGTAIQTTGTDGPNTYAIIFRLDRRLGGLSAAVACVLAYRLRRELKRR